MSASCERLGVSNRLMSLISILYRSELTSSRDPFHYLRARRKLLTLSERGREEISTVGGISSRGRAAISHILTSTESAPNI